MPPPSLRLYSTLIHNTMVTYRWNIAAAIQNNHICCLQQYVYNYDKCNMRHLLYGCENTKSIKKRNNTNMKIKLKLKKKEITETLNNNRKNLFSNAPTACFAWSFANEP